MLSCWKGFLRFLPVALLAVVFCGCGDGAPSGTTSTSEPITIKNAEEKGIDPEGAGVKGQKLEDRKTGTGAMH